MNAGMTIGDKIISVNDKVENSYNYLLINIKGEPGTTVKITIIRENKKMDFILERQILDD
jgi:C-terminal processing protease CtpA/Prc